jgi:hypothetical protein
MKKLCFLFCIAIVSVTFADLDSKAQKTRQFYASLKYQDALSRSMLGGDIEFGLFKKNFFFSFDFGAGGNPETYMGDFGWIVSWGGRIKPNDAIQIVPGGSFGCWLYPIDEEGTDIVFGAPTFGGPFVKLLIGKNRSWFEISNRILFGTNFNTFIAVHQIMLGFTYIR